jgi:hypothetical protein
VRRGWLADHACSPFSFSFVSHFLKACPMLQNCKGAS